MRKLQILILILSLFMPATIFAQVRGTARMQGVVTDKATGKPIAGATVTVALASEKTEPIIVQTNSGGHWSVLGLVGGQWNIDVAAPGYVTSRGRAQVSEASRMPLIHTELVPEVKEEPVIAPAPIIPKEAIDAIDQGQDLMKQEKYKEAATNFEKALPMVPLDKPEAARIRTQLMQVMAQAYYRAGDLNKAISMLELVTAANPADTPSAVLLANVYLENGQLDAGKALLEKLPPTAITDPTAYVNLGILFLNKKNPADAVTYFGKAVELNPNAADGYYYRGLAEAQLKKMQAARADFEKVITLSPDSPEAKDARAMLAAMPKK